MSDFTLKLTPEGERNFIRLQEFSPKFRIGIRQGLRFSGQALVRQAKVLFREPKTGQATFLRGKSRRRFRRSAPGEAPARQSGALLRSTGFLVNGIESLEFGAGGERKDVTITRGDPVVTYAEFLEKGTPGGQLKPRPFIQPSVKLQLGNIQNHVETEIARQLKT